jgi:hypothetical protein
LKEKKFFMPLNLAGYDSGQNSIAESLICGYDEHIQKVWAKTLKKKLQIGILTPQYFNFESTESDPMYKCASYSISQVAQNQFSLF